MSQQRILVAQKANGILVAQQLTNGWPVVDHEPAMCPGGHEGQQCLGSSTAEPMVDHEPAACPGGLEGQWGPGSPTVDQILTTSQQSGPVTRKANGVLLGQLLTSG